MGFDEKGCLGISLCSGMYILKGSMAFLLGETSDAQKCCCSVHDCVGSTIGHFWWFCWSCEKPEAEGEADTEVINVSWVFSEIGFRCWL